MAEKYKIEKFNINNFSSLKMKMKVVLRKSNCLAAIEERLTKITDDDKWNEIDNNAIADLHLPLSDRVLFNMVE